jgi:hypothetical protein
MVYLIVVAKIPAPSRKLAAPCFGSVASQRCFAPANGGNSCIGHSSTPSLSDAEPGEDLAQHFLGVDPARQAAQRDARQS